MTDSKLKMRWHNPKFDAYEWRKLPSSDEEALKLLEGYTGCEYYARIYTEWREAGSSIMAALIRAGEAAEFGRPEND